MLNSPLSIHAVAAGLSGSATRVEDFLAVKRTMLKHSGDNAVGEKLEMEALHVSSASQNLVLTVCCAGKVGFEQRCTARSHCLYLAARNMKLVSIQYAGRVKTYGAGPQEMNVTESGMGSSAGCCLSNTLAKVAYEPRCHLGCRRMGRAC